MPTGQPPRRFKTNIDIHQFRKLPKPEHPLISVLHLDAAPFATGSEPMNLVFDFYSIALKRDFNAKVK